MVNEDGPRYKAVLIWSQSDPEERLGFKGGKYTDVNNRLSCLLGVCLTVLFYLTVFATPDTPISQMLTQRGRVPYAIVFFTCWSLAILFLKWWKLNLQRRALGLSVVPQQPDFVLSPASAAVALQRMRGLVDNPHHFVLLRRVELALSNLNNIGRVSDVAEILDTQGQNDEDHMDSSYSLVRGFVWCVPVLGFIGTVLGLSAAIGQFGGVVKTAKAIDELKMALQEVTGGLSIAFDTTLEGLVAALVVQLLMTVLRKREEDFLHDCTEYCHSHIVSKLRLINLASDEQEAIEMDMDAES